ncbi:MAG: aminotransferase class I/II-fold pyridoxal phosphate-dependent enzyme, partial [Clostridia bacterium]|nr:aminotransferase class I/II-fold pyridoxal phosphate-dependent enzyme [Clostridia bacterium]
EQAAMGALAMDDSYGEQLKAIFRDRRDRLCRALAAIDGLKIKKNAGAFYLWLDVSRLDDDAAFCQKLLQDASVALTPGSAFCCPGYVRLAYTKDMALLLEAAARIRRFVDETYNNSSGVSR